MRKLTILLTILLCSCQSQEQAQDVIRLEEAMHQERIVSLSELGKTVENIQLETNDSSLVGNIVPLYHNGNFYAVDAASQICKIFDENGKYVGNLGRQGRGPGEYIRMGATLLSFDKVSHHVFLYSDRKIIEYSPSGKYLKEITIPLDSNYIFNIHKILRFENNFAVSIGNMGGKNDLLFLDDAGNYLTEIPNHYAASEINQPLSFPDNPAIPQIIALPANLRIADWKILFAKPNEDTVFTVNQSMQQSVAYILDFGKYKTPKTCTSLSERMNYIQIQDIRTVETPEYIFFSFFFGKHAPQGVIPPVVKGIYYKQTQVLQLLKRPELDKDGILNDLGSQGVFWPQSSSDSGDLLMAVYPDNGNNPSIMRVKTHP